MELWHCIGGSGKKKKKLYVYLVNGDIFMVFATEYHRFVWFYMGNFACVFARLVSPVCNGRKLNRGGRIQRDELFDANYPF